MSQASSLKRLILNNNRLVGPEPIEFSDMASLRHVNVADNALGNVVGKKGEMVIEGTVEKPVTRGDLLEQTTHLVEDGAVRDFMRGVMLAAVMRDGLLEVNRAGLPESIDPDDDQSAIDDLNRRLIEAGERVESLLDLERAMELYGESGIDVPDAESVTELMEGEGVLIHSESGSEEYRSAANGSGVAKSTATSSSAGINCPTLKAHWPHESDHAPGYIPGTGTGGCAYVAGPTQHLICELESL